MKRLIQATASAALLACPALAGDNQMIEEIDVEFDLEAVESPVAADFWSDLEGDLEDAIAARLTSRLCEEGSEISVDIDEFALSNSFQGAIGVDSVLTASVEVKNEEDPTKNSYYELKVTVDESGMFETTEDGKRIVTHEREEVYAAVVSTFADGVVKRLR